MIDKSIANQFPVLETKRLLLREFIINDAKSVYDIFSNGTVTKYYNIETMTDIEQAQRLISTRVSLFELKTGLRWAITFKEEEIVIGSCGYFNINGPNGYAEIGYDLHQNFWRKGIMEEALKEIINFGFSGNFLIFLNRIEALTYLENVASVRLLLKLGFKEEGIRREYGFWKGRYHDLRSFSLLRREWLISQS